MTAFAAFIVATGAWLLIGPGSRGRLNLPVASRRSMPVPYLAAVFAGVGVAVLVGGMTGILAGCVVGIVAKTVLGRIGPDVKPRREALARQAPDAVDCLAACLAAGAPLWAAVRVVAAAFGDPVGGVLERAAERHALGSAPAETFSEMLEEPALAPVARILVRSAESGGSLSASLVACGQRLREERASMLEVRARAVGVKAVAPLVACFLPAFILVAVVPVLGSMAVGLTDVLHLP